MRLKIALFDMCERIFNHYGSCDDCPSKICCMAYAPAIYRHEIETMAKKLNLSKEVFKRKHVVSLNSVGCRWALNKPCGLLKDEKCSVYGSHPQSCSKYPFEVSIHPFFIMLEGIELCPVATIISNEIQDFQEKFSRFFVETEASIEYKNLIQDATETALEQVGDAWKEKDIETIRSELTIIGPLYFVCFYLWKIKQKSDNEITKAMTSLDDQRLLNIILYER